MIPSPVSINGPSVQPFVQIYRPQQGPSYSPAYPSAPPYDYRAYPLYPPPSYYYPPPFILPPPSRPTAFSEPPVSEKRLPDVIKVNQLDSPIAKPLVESEQNIDGASKPLTSTKSTEAKITLSEQDQRILATIKKFRQNNPKWRKFMTADAVERLAMGLEHPESSLKLALDTTFGEDIRTELHHKRWWRRRAARSGLKRLDTVLRFFPMPKTVKSNARGFIDDMLKEKKADWEKTTKLAQSLDGNLIA